MQFAKEQVYDSRIHPGTKYVVRTVGQMQRSLADAALIDARRRYILASENARDAWNQATDLIGEDATLEDFVRSATPSEKADWSMNRQREECILYGEIVPADIRLLLARVEAADGQPAMTAEEFLQVADRATLDEAHAFCRNGRGLSEEEQKNS